jgi:multidrug efflux pump subunit AcrB
MTPRTLLLALLEGLSERRVAVGAVCASMLVLAGVALVRMPLQLLPEIRYPQVRVIADLPGQTSRVVEESVNEPIEAALAGTPGIVRMESRSGDGRSYIDLFFAPGYDLDRALRDVTQAVQRAQAQIPPDFPEPRIFAVATSTEPALQIAVGGAGLTPAEIRQRLRTTLVPRLRSISGVEAVYIGREEVQELVVEVDPALQAASGVHLDALETALLDATRAPASGALRATGFEGILVLGSTSWAPERLETRPVPVAGTAHAVPLGTLARVTSAPSVETLRARLDGQPAVIVEVYRAQHAHSLRMAREVAEVLANLEASPTFAGLDAHILFDDSVVTRSAVRSVVTAAVGGALLAMLLLWFALGHRRYTLLVAVIVATSLAASVIALSFLGQSLNLLTLAGLLLSVGLGLDYAIIYFDRLDRITRDEGAGGLALAAPGAALAPPHLRAMVDVAGPLLGALLTTLAAVTPFLLVRGMVALLFRPLILTVVVAAVFCFLFALVLLPVFARADADGAADAAARFSFRTVPARWFRGHRPAAVWGTTAVLVAVLILGGRALPFEVLPVVDDGFVEARITHPSGIPAAEMDDLARLAEARLAEVPGTAALFTSVGGYFREGLPAFRPGTADFMVRVDLDAAGGSSHAWADHARRALSGLGVPGLRVSITTPRIRGVQTRLSDADLIVVLSRDDGDLLALGEVESRVMDALRGVDGLTDISRMRGGVSPRWMAEPRFDAMAAAGAAPDALDRAVAYALDGRVLRQRMANGEPLALRIRYDRRVAGGPDQLQGIRIPTAGGGDVQLSDVVTFRLVEEPTHIERREGQRVVRVAGQLDPAGPGARAVERSVRQALEQSELPAGVGWWLEGELDALRETSRTFAVALGLALLLVLTLLLAQYGSVALAVAGFITIPLSGAGAIILLGVLGRPLDAVALAGLLIAVGIVANNVILVLSQAQAAAASRKMQAASDFPVYAPGDGPASDAAGNSVSAERSRDLVLEGALVDAGRDRLRPVTLTVLSTVLGMSPLLLGGGQVFGLLQPLAIALTGALLLSVPLACMLLPSLAASLARRVA